MLIRFTEFIISNSDVEKCPKEKIPEYAFIGRSNVGKSSLVNMICNKKNLAKTSGRPGKTQLINHFKINKSWFLVDLPGYGYAKTSKSNKKKFNKIITSYFENRKQIISAFILIDIRHEPQLIDLDFMSWLNKNKIPLSIVFTKSDKLGKKIILDKINFYLKKLNENWENLPNFFVTSALKREGSKEILEYIGNLNVEFRK
mgnify:CR=1 FL=1